MTELRFHHIGVACRDLSKTRAFIKATHDIVSDSGIVHDPKQCADLCLLTDRSGVRIELIHGEAVASLVKKGFTYYHCCYEVENVETALDFMKQHGCFPVTKPTKAVLFDQRRVVFLMSPLGLVELVES
jgi:methylmalonyl-CoA/ethylmalonyl-CoA epimerase